MLKPLLGKVPAKGEKEERHPALSTFAGAEALLQEDPRFARAPPRERYATTAQQAVHLAIQECKWRALVFWTQQSIAGPEACMQC